MPELSDADMILASVLILLSSGTPFNSPPQTVRKECGKIPEEHLGIGSEASESEDETSDDEVA